MTWHDGAWHVVMLCSVRLPFVSVSGRRRFGVGVGFGTRWSCVSSIFCAVAVRAVTVDLGIAGGELLLSLHQCIRENEY